MHIPTLYRLIALFGLLCMVTLPGRAELDANLSAFAPYIGKTWRGEFANSTPERPMVDISVWQEALQGKAVRITHSLNQGEYEGETLIVWNRDKQELEFFYFTTAGFYTRGTAKFDESRFIAYEEVTGSEEGISQVRSEVSTEADGSMKQQAFYLKEGEWIRGHSAHYRVVK